MGVHGDGPCAVHRKEGIVTDDFHADGCRCIGYQDADGAQADHAQGFTLEFGPHELALAFFHQLGHFRAAAL
ncbi:hypothetical protein SDC9_200424 [bioreactor metagenome]|uniref:Uncharacterized protein n=1 Tax=bioreactor metagenome TaxID=1076179 RepID=A0A645IN73_9ZZZZ